MQLVNKPSWFARLAASIARAFKWIYIRVKQWFQLPEQQPDAAQAQPVELSGLDQDEPYEDYSEKIEGLDDIVVKLGLHKRVSASHQYMYEMGRRDGALGVSMQNLANIARATAQALFRHVNVILKGRLGALSAELNAAQNILQNDENVYKREQTYYDYVKYQYRFFPRNYSYLLFALYLFFGIALIIADMPLALELIQKGFDLPVGPEEVSLIHLPENFWGVVAGNWETVITAVGIALCTIYIKIYYDEFIGTPYANRLMTFKRFLEENGFDEPHNIKDEVNKEHRRKGFIKTTLAAVTIAAIILLALFRLQTAQKNGELAVNFFSGSAFIAITILFPIIGGICLSYSLNNFQNLMRLSDAKKKSTLCRIELLKAVKEFTEVKKNHEDIIAATERFGDEERVVEEYKNYLIAFYDRGYAIGGMQPEKYARGEDFYSKILEWRNIAVSRKINHHIGKMN
jgi:hypothetical protein